MVYGEKGAYDIVFSDPDFSDWTPQERSYAAIREHAYFLAMHFGWTLEGGIE